MDNRCANMTCCEKREIKVDGYFFCKRCAQIYLKIVLEEQRRERVLSSIALEFRKMVYVHLESNE